MTAGTKGNNLPLLLTSAIHKHVDHFGLAHSFTPSNNATSALFSLAYVPQTIALFLI